MKTHTISIMQGSHHVQLSNRQFMEPKGGHWLVDEECIVHPAVS